MMKALKKNITTILVLAVLLILLTGYATANDAAILLQQSPPQGGTITPGDGMHNYSYGSFVNISAVPKPGYQFVYWLGDVADPTASTTTAQLNSPKIVIAVFQRVEYDSMFFVERDTSAPNEQLFGGGGFSMGGPVSAPSAYDRDTPDYPQYPEDEEEPDFPVPEPIPEPATMALIGIGAAIALRKRNR